MVNSICPMFRFGTQYFWFRSRVRPRHATSTSIPTLTPTLAKVLKQSSEGYLTKFYMWRHCPTYGLIKPLLIYILFLTTKRDAFRIRVSLFIERCQERMHPFQRRLYSQAITKLVNLKQGSRLFILMQRLINKKKIQSWGASASIRDILGIKSLF